MQDDGEGEWGDGDDAHHFIQEEATRVATLPTSTRYRTFTDAQENETVRIGRAEQDFFLHKKRRYEDNGCDAALQPYATPLLRVAKAPFDVAARRMDTFTWLTAQTRGAADIVNRFALDRKIGVPPSQACLNKALLCLGASGEVDCVLDIVEDAAMDSGTLAQSTVLMAIRALHSQPVRAARLALSLQCTLSPGTALPLPVWSDLGSALARHAQRLPQPLDEHFMELLDATIRVVRDRSDTLSETLLVDFGSCLLASKRPLSAAVKLVGDELLSGRNRTDADDDMDGDRGGTDAGLPLGAFLTDLLVALCTSVRDLSFAAGRLGSRHSRGRKTTRADSEALRDGDASDSFEAAKDAADVCQHLVTRVGVSNVAELMTFCGDVVKYAYARRIRLAPKAFDAVLALCDKARDYHRLCILFTAMCVLSVPTLRSTLRVVEVLNAVPPLQAKVAELVGRTAQALIVWCLQRHGSVLALPARSTADEENALTALCAATGLLLTSSARSAAPSVNWKAPAAGADETGDPHPTPASSLAAPQLSQIHDVAALLLLECPTPQFGAAFLSAVVAHVRERHQSSMAHSTAALTASPGRPSREQLQALEALNTTALTCLLWESDTSAAEMDLSENHHRLFEDVAKRDGGGYADAAIKEVLSSSQVYCNVLDTSGVNILAAQPAAEAAFAKMMAGYVSKTGAITVLPVEFLSSSGGITAAARSLVRRWRHAHADWFAVLPLSMSFQLSGTSDITIAADFFLRVRRSGHQKVALMTGSSTNAETAKSLNVQPSIYLPDLLERLGVKVPTS